MKRFAIVLALALAVQAILAGDDDEAYAFDRFYAGVAGTAVLPQGGGRMGDRAGAAFRAGCYIGELFAVEGEAACLGHRAGLAARGLWHWWGYERLDPFFTFGAKGWMNDGQVGPCGGLGAFYHLTESLSLRADADATLGLDTRREMVYSLCAGLQISF